MNIYEAMQFSSSVEEKIKKFNEAVKNTGVSIGAESFIEEGLIIWGDDKEKIILTYSGDLAFSYDGSSSGEGGFFSGGMDITFKRYQALRTALFANFGR